MTEDVSRSRKIAKEAQYAPGNTAPDGGYVVGKGKPPESGKFRKGDGRKRGRRAKGTQNLATDFLEELQDDVTITVNGKARRVTRQRSLVMRAIDNASRGQNGALKLVFEMTNRIDTASAEQGEITELPYLDRLSIDEQIQFATLMAKALDETWERPPRSPLQLAMDPENPKNWIQERTPEGLHIHRCNIPGMPVRLDRIENNAYFSAAMPIERLASDDDEGGEDGNQ